MTIARAHLVDPSATRWYHCVTRCVRRAFLLGEGMHNPKSWIEHRLEELATLLANHGRDVGKGPIADSRGSGDRSARLDTVGMSVTRTPLTLRSITWPLCPLPAPPGTAGREAPVCGEHLVE